MCVVGCGDGCGGILRPIFVRRQSFRDRRKNALFYVVRFLRARALATTHTTPHRVLGGKVSEVKNWEEKNNFGWKKID